MQASCFAAALFAALMLLLLQKPIKVAAAESNCETLALYNPNRCKDKPKFEYHLSASCVNETTVSVWFQEPAGNGDNLEQVTMQYTCYNATTGEELTHAFTYESEILSEQYNLTSQLFSEGNCVFTGCAKKSRLQCWLYITKAVNVSCAGLQDQNNPSTSLASFTPSSVFNTITVTPTAISFSSITADLQPSVIITRPDVSRPSNFPILPPLDTTTSLFHSPVPSSMAVNNNNVPGSIMQSKEDPRENKPANYDIVTVTASVAVIVISSVSLIALLLSFVACRRLYRKTKMSSSFYAKDTEGLDEGNIYVGKLEDNDNTVKGSILTLVQPLNYKLSSKAIDHRYIVNHRDNTMLLIGEQLCPYDRKVPILHSSLSNSCHSLPQKAETTSQRREGTRCSSQYLPQANCYLTFDDARMISESSCEDSSCTSSLQDHDDVFTKNTSREESKELKQHLFVIQSHMKNLSTSSGYLSTSPHDDEQGGLISKMENRQYPSMDQDYIYDMLPSV